MDPCTADDQIGADHKGVGYREQRGRGGDVRVILAGSPIRIAQVHQHPQVGLDEVGYRVADEGVGANRFE
ncbi:hypothetical protein OSH41_21145 [Mycobacterium ulcerans]|nr:hypothetical protein [Mycobacterium ulcerans]MEB4232589.1 hypothetical protein [Mycobacterium ulcerans]MEB4354939.1 hypothetical protein [Mycobacterium ulcerans]